MKAPLVIRQDAAQACIDRFSGKPMKWGTVDCGRIVAHNLRHLGIGTSLVKGLKYTNEIGAAKALRSLGFTGLGDAMDALGDRVFRIAPAMATQGDVVGMAAAGELWDMALTVSVGNGRLFGIAHGYAQPFQPDLAFAVAAWRCNPWRT